MCMRDAFPSVLECQFMLQQTFSLKYAVSCVLTAMKLPTKLTDKLLQSALLMLLS